MIRICLPSGKSLEDVIDEFNPSWRADNVVWDGASSPWSDIKEVFASLQGCKCAYCERVLQGTPSENKVESDIEHFRPKKKTVVGRGEIPAKSGRADGYAWLATNVANYLLSCKTCNSSLKKNFFPISGSVGLKNQSVPKLNAREKPVLLYPIGEFDTDPEDLIDWEGFTPVAKISVATDAFANARAERIIAFFGLAQRQDIQRGCAEQIIKVWRAFQLRNDPEEGLSTSDFLRRCQSEHTEVHAACTRAFLRLVATDSHQARIEVRKAEKYLAELKNLYQLPKKLKRSRKIP